MVHKVKQQSNAAVETHYAWSVAGGTTSAPFENNAVEANVSPLHETKKQIIQNRVASALLASQFRQMIRIHELESGRRTACVNPQQCKTMLDALREKTHLAFDARGVVLHIDAGCALEGCFDDDLVYSLLETAVYQAACVADRAVTLKCTVDDGCLVFKLDHDGGDCESNFMIIDEESTLDFARKIAASHEYRGRCGEVVVDHQHNSEAPCFELHLP